MKTSEEKITNVAVVIPAKNEAATIVTTIRACRAIPGADLLLVVDDGSTDNTQDLARTAGAVVVRHSITRGKASAMETGVKVVAMRNPEDGPGRYILFIDADLGESATACALLVETVRSGIADCAIGLLPRQKGAGGRGIVVGLARRAIERATGWSPVQPLSGQRCLTQEALSAAMPLASGWGVETGMTIDLLVAGLTLIEVPCNLQHRISTNNWIGYRHRLAQYRDIWFAIWQRRLRRGQVRAYDFAEAAAAQEPGRAYHIDVKPKN